MCNAHLDWHLRSHVRLGRTSIPKGSIVDLMPVPVTVMCDNPLAMSMTLMMENHVSLTMSLLMMKYMMEINKYIQVRCSAVLNAAIKLRNNILHVTIWKALNVCSDIIL